MGKGIGTRIAEDITTFEDRHPDHKGDQLLNINITRRTLVMALSCVDMCMRDVDQARHRELFQQTHNELRREEERMLKGYGKGVMHA